MSETKEQYESHGKNAPGGGFIISLGVSILIIIGGFFYLAFGDARERSASAEELRRRCDSEYGVYVEGMTRTDEEVSQFSLCIPERAFECIDVE